MTADSVNIFKNRFDKHCSHLRFCTDIDSRTCSRRDDDDVSMKISRQATSLWKTDDDEDDDDDDEYATDNEC